MTGTVAERAAAIIEGYHEGRFFHFGELQDAIAAALREYGDQRVAEEREACAKAADRYGEPVPGANPNATTAIRFASRNIAAAIRARGTP